MAEKALLDHTTADNSAALSRRILLLAPTKKDAATGSSLLARAGLEHLNCTSLVELCREVEAGAGAAIIPNEAVRGDGVACMVDVLRHQPPWSSLPILVLTPAERPLGRSLGALIEIGNVTLLRRPLNILEFFNAVRAALRDRSRQYLVRDYVAEMDRQAAELREADRRKDEFLAMLAHELRNPLAPIRNGLEVMKLAADDPTTFEHTREMMDRQVRLLARLVDDLLDVSRITRGKADLRREHVDLRDAAGRAVETIRPLLEASRHKLTVKLPNEPVPVWADPTRLAQVVGNLLNNAAKYSEDQTPIELEVRREGTSAVVSVRDQGVGIAPEMLPKVFDLFTQAQRTIDRSQGGLGIGLTLVRSLMELHGGTVEAKSLGIGHGSEFIARMPIRHDEASVRPKENAKPTSAARQSRRVLVVDDNVDAAKSMALLLRFHGHQVSVAHSGPQALELAVEQHPEIVLLDIGLPGMDGYEVARAIRTQSFGRAMLLVALTGYGQEDDRRRTHDAGFDHHLTKPADIKVLSRLIEEFQPVG